MALSRPEGWTTIEEPVELERALASVPHGATAIVYCLSLWVANVFESRPVDALSAAAARAAAERPGLTIAVTNEVGMGIVPETPLGRRFRDLAGIAHQRLAAIADEVYFAVLGTMLRIKPTIGSADA